MIPDRQRYQLLREMAGMLNLQITNVVPAPVVYGVLMLPDDDFRQMFLQLSFNMNSDVHALQALLRQIAFDALYQRVHSSGASRSNEVQTPDSKTSVIISDTPRCQQQSAFREQFMSAVKATLLVYNQNVQQMDDVDLCRELLEHLKAHSQPRFWSQISQLIITKTPVQLKEYFQKSFQKCLYTSTIDERDKTLLTQLMKVMPGSRPSEIADEFQKIVPNANYFKRSLVMFITHAKK
ncbi:SANT/Myb_domain [Hexamita inflata]|uniref:SANT/Myb domain n=1 Tax=Hexamita inflata TaxID=28002 RepID=A0AA86PZI6_9EUKA|nr:SANT/Myb domain [Hexamita inflata]CAI9949289.1 SANT/Myb domain [Hexamita inflata]